MKLGKTIYGIVFNICLFVVYNQFIKGGLMTTRTTNAELAETIAGQQQNINKALDRINNLADDLAVLKGELRRFKQDAARDIQSLEKRVNR